MHRMDIDPEQMKLKVGEGKTFKVVAKYNDGQEKDITENVEIVVNDTKVAKLDAENKIIAQNAGVTSMTIKYGEKSIRALIEVEKH